MVKKINKAAISYDDDLVESLRDDEKAQIDFIKASIEENRDVPSAILEAVEF